MSALKRRDSKMISSLRRFLVSVGNGDADNARLHCLVHIRTFVLAGPTFHFFLHCLIPTTFAFRL